MFDEVAPLCHEFGYDAMEGGIAVSGFVIAGGGGGGFFLGIREEMNKILDGAGNDVGA